MVPFQPWSMLGISFTTTPHRSTIWQLNSSIEAALKSNVNRSLLPSLLCENMLMGSNLMGSKMVSILQVVSVQPFLLSAKVLGCFFATI